MRVTPALLLVAACGGSSTPKTPQDLARERSEAQRKQLESERPKNPIELRQRIAFRPPERCGQGPYRIETPALGAKYAEELRVYACGLHDIAGNYRYSVHPANKPARTVTESAFGFGDRDNTACKVDRASSTQVAGVTVDATGQDTTAQDTEATRTTGTAGAKPGKTSKTSKASK
ncbi:MAG TPA: hypothetical protein VIV11_05865, partial [Kofleriaceae bacterium]